MRAISCLVLFLGLALQGCNYNGYWSMGSTRHLVDSEEPPVLVDELGTPTFWAFDTINLVWTLPADGIGRLEEDETGHRWWSFMNSRSMPTRIRYYGTPPVIAAALDVLFFPVSGPRDALVYLFDVLPNEGDSIEKEQVPEMPLEYYDGHFRTSTELAKTRE